MSAPDRFPEGAIWSLWDMIERYGELVSKAVSSLIIAEQFWGIEKFQPINALAPSADAVEEADEEIRASTARAAIHNLRQLCILTDIDGMEDQIGRVERRLGYAQRKEVARDFRALLERLRDELKHEHFFHLDRRDVSSYGKKELFGAQVAAKFPNHIEDVEAAGNCLALQQSTACVFHLMRIMEASVQRLGKLLGVQLEPKQETWFEICNRASKAVTNRPAKTKKAAAKNAALGAAVAHLQTVRLAWRNEVMHPKQTYTREEAHAVFNATRTFMIDLADLI